MDGLSGITMDQALGPDIHLAIDGSRLAPTAIDGSDYRFSFSGLARDVVICSQTNVPCHIHPSSHDQRRLGVAISLIRLSTATFAVELRHNDALLTIGYYGPEADFRWTDGAGVIPSDVLSLLGHGTIEATITVVNQLPIYADGAALGMPGQSIRSTTGLQRLPHIIANHQGSQGLPLEDRAKKYEGVAFSASGNILAVAAAGANSILLFRRGSAGIFEKEPFQTLSGGVQGLDFPHDVSFGQTKSGEVLASVERCGVVSVWLLNRETSETTDAPTKRIFLNTPPDQYVDAICFLPQDSPYFATANHHTSTISFYKTRLKSQTELHATPETTFFSPFLNGPEGIAFSACGCWLAVANHGNNTVAVFRRLYSSQAGSAPRFDPRPATLISDPEMNRPHSVAFSPVFNGRAWPAPPCRAAMPSR